ncbi:MAG: FmdB family transcriptional regulator [Actinomycetota bacterium]|nr:FmdB family transcriptional regulator [Actinomycetota bacterium]
MPTYQYACTDAACDHRFEQFQSFTDDALTECPVCAGRLRKVYGSVGVVFKGSGFYRNDSRAETNGAKQKSGAKDTEPATTGSSNSSSKETGTGAASSSGSSDSTTTKDRPAAKAGTSSSSANS